jgi:subtilisin family serine protease
VQLVPSGDELVFESDLADPRAEATASLASVGQVATQISAVRSAVRHWSVRLATADPAQQQAAAAALRTSASVTFAQPTYRLTGQRSGVLVPINMLSVLFSPRASGAEIDSIANALGLSLIRPPYPDSGFFEHVFRYPPRTNQPLGIAATLHRHPLVRWANPIGLSPIYPTYVPSDPYYPFQFHLRNDTLYNGVRVDINAEAAWNITRGTSTVRVAVIGDGVEWGHPDLWGAFSSALGYDAIHQAGWTDDAFTPFENDNHETMAAGLIFADHNTQGVAGIAPLTILRAARIFRGTDSSPPRWFGNPQQIANAINWAWQSGQSDVISNSWHYGQVPQQVIDQAIDNALSLGRNGKGAVVVFSAGNSSPQPIPEPNNHPGVVTVGAIQPTGPRASYSQTGPELDIVAPSGAETDRCVGQVVTTDRVGSPGCNNGPSGSVDYTTKFSGTSAAAPQVAAVAALILSVQPNLTVSQIRSRLCATAIPWGPANDYGCGKVDAFRAVTPPPTVTIAGPSSVRPNATCVWTANVSGGLPPYSYSWTVNSSAVGGNSPELIYQNGGSSFTINVLVTDAATGTANKSKSVTVSASAPICQS